MSAQPGDQEMLLFVHILKTGGSSLKAMLRQVFQDRRQYPSRFYETPAAISETLGTTTKDFSWLLPYIDVGYVRTLAPERKQQIDLLIGHLPYCIGELFDRPIRYISLFRDPVARTISHLRHALTIDPQYQSKTIEELYDDPFFFSTAIHNLQTRFFAHTMTSDLNMALDPMELTDADLTRARQRISGLDFVGILEDFDNALLMFEEQFSFTFASKTIRRFDSKKYKVSRSMVKRIAKDNQHDLELYEFVKELYYRRRRKFLKRAA